jgi:hypothetical protein
MFKIGDKVIFDANFYYNGDLSGTYDQNKSYTIVNIINNDVCLDVDPKRPLYHERFLLDPKQIRKEKLKRLNNLVI